ncbi:MAG: hypothetical protein PHN88_02860 [Ignavibacteria bacterium]|nr:hypothetical protein [Ignavibacteria bacterium]
MATIITIVATVIGGVIAAFINAGVIWFLLKKYITKVDGLEKQQSEMKYNYMDRFADLKTFVDDKINNLLEKILENK